MQPQRFFLIVKGCETAVRRALLAHDVVNCRVGEFLNGSIPVYGSARFATLVAWFCEPPKVAPFPPGTLLWYKPVGEAD